MNKLATIQLGEVSGALLQFSNSLPPLPDVVRYQDDFDNKVRSLTDFRIGSSFQLVMNGKNVTFDFSRFNTEHEIFAKSLFFYFIANDFSVSTAYSYLLVLRDIGPETLSEILFSGPSEIKAVWSKLFVRSELSDATFPAVRATLVFLSRHHLCGWSPDYLDFIRITLPAPFKDKYAGVRTGEVFLSAQEEANIVSYLDNLAHKATHSPESIVNQPLEHGCMLLCSYLFGMRPIQIAMLTMRDVRIWVESEMDNHQAVHLTFKMVKQRHKNKAFPLTRRVKHEWTPIVVLLYGRAFADGRSGDDRLFDVLSAGTVGKAIKDLATALVGGDVSATDIRHTAAQRLVDAGASQEEVAEFLGHADVTTCLVYYSSSPNQAERVNEALGISPVYQQVAKIAHAKFITTEELAHLKGNQQIAGVPHGIPISGIGGCIPGQPSCQYNPITSCYSCQKFMPVTDINLHRRVLGDMRSVVKVFVGASRDDENSPAFMQLKRTIASIQQVIVELEGPTDA